MSAAPVLEGQTLHSRTWHSHEPCSWPASWRKLPANPQTVRASSPSAVWTRWPSTPPAQAQACVAQAASGAGTRMGASAACAATTGPPAAPPAEAGCPRPLTPPGPRPTAGPPPPRAPLHPVGVAPCPQSSPAPAAPVSPRPVCAGRWCVTAAPPPRSPPRSALACGSGGSSRGSHPGSRPFVRTDSPAPHSCWPGRTVPGEQEHRDARAAELRGPRSGSVPLPGDVPRQLWPHPRRGHVFLPQAHQQAAPALLRDRQGPGPAAC